MAPAWIEKIGKAKRDIIPTAQLFFLSSSFLKRNFGFSYEKTMNNRRIHPVQISSLLLNSISNE
jgi:hypothetical protein